MVVAYELGKTVDEIAHLSPEDIAYWLAFFKVREKRIEQAIKRRRNK